MNQPQPVNSDVQGTPADTSRVKPFVELQISTRPKPGSMAELSEAELVYDALSAHRDTKIDELRELIAMYADHPDDYDRAKILTDLTQGEFAATLTYVETLSDQLDILAINLAADLRILHRQHTRTHE